VLETVIKLRASAVALASTGAKTKPLHALTESLSVVALKVSARAPEGECRLRLWDEDGRSRDPVGQDELDHWQWNFSHSTDRTVELKDSQLGFLPPAKLQNRTITWSVRVFASAPDSGERYELRIKLLQDGVDLPNGTFDYSGPLRDDQELTGRFHFKLEEPGQAA
jgi:hypothetical protein